MASMEAVSGSKNRRPVNDPRASGVHGRFHHDLIVSRSGFILGHAGDGRPADDPELIERSWSHTTAAKELGASAVDRLQVTIPASVLPCLHRGGRDVCAPCCGMFESCGRVHLMDVVGSFTKPCAMPDATAALDI